MQIPAKRKTVVTFDAALKSANALTSYRSVVVFAGDWEIAPNAMTGWLC